MVSSLEAQTTRLRLDKGHVLYSEPLWIGQRTHDITQLVDATTRRVRMTTKCCSSPSTRIGLLPDRHRPVGLSETIGSSCMRIATKLGRQAI
jgi:hypothetical protein